MHQVEHGRVAEGEAHANGEVDKEPGDPGPVRGDDGAQHEGQVEAS